MPPFTDSVRRNIEQGKARVKAVWLNSMLHMHRSIVMGSSVTGAPGQVVQDVGGGNLRDSWQLVFPTPTSARSTTTVPYAESNEDGIARPGGGPYIQRSAIGGRHSISKTRDGLIRIIEYENDHLGNG